MPPTPEGFFVSTAGLSVSAISQLIIQWQEEGTGAHFVVSLSLAKVDYLYALEDRRAYGFQPSNLGIP